MIGCCNTFKTTQRGLVKCKQSDCMGLIDFQQLFMICVTTAIIYQRPIKQAKTVLATALHTQFTNWRRMMANIGPFELDTIVAGDAYKLIKEIPDKSIDLIYTDIPYLYNQGGSGSSELGERTAKKRLELMGCSDVYLENKDTTRGEALRIAKNKKKQNLDIISIEDGINYDILNDFVRVMKRVNCFIWCSKLQLFDIMKFFLDGTLKQKIGKEIYFEMLCWCKTNPTPTTNNSWLPDIEYCLYFREQGVPYNNGYDLKHKYYVSPANVADKERFYHPTCKPVDFVKKHIQHTSQEGDTVLDCFCGSGTTCVAAKDTNRHYLGIELENKWVEISRDRLNNTDARGQYSMFTF